MNNASNVDFFAKLNTPTAGWAAIFVCAVCFGTNLIPIKKFNMGDGLSCQWLMCNGILIVGIAVQLIVGTLYRVPVFHPLAMLGGALWAAGNSLTVVIIESIGLSLSTLIWSTANMLFGFTTSRFGVFGIPPKIPSRPTMNYVGVAIAVISGVFLAIVAGSIYGNTFVPTIYIQSMVKGASQAGLDYVFAYFVGIWSASTIIFVVYALVKCNRPWFPAKQAILPSILSGILFGLAQSSWFIANAALGEPITFPIVSTCPALIATLGRRNLIILCVAMCVTITGLLLNAFAL
ncbi:transmembrane protein 144 [Echinococcus multilocularis]|uniref:Transmembrane protein 144 n=1 Tax=Echinococcus multilocularis TaxID=6211 RepID=A0A068Y454_ECHMU|nr:transmembrane protein 144 [Echinococcus multilocularis]